MPTSELIGLRLREARAREQAAVAEDISVRHAHLNIASILNAQIVDITAVRLAAAG